MVSIKVMLVDDHAVVLRGLQFYLSTLPDFAIVGEARNGKEAVEKAAEIRPDVVLMDLMMTEMNGIEATAYLREHFPEIKVLVLTSFADRDYVLPALQAGAVGYLLKEMDPLQIAEAIRGAASGGSIQLHPEVTQQLMMMSTADQRSVGGGAVSRLEEPQPEMETITPREKEVLLLIARGMSNKEIAAQLGIAEKTVKAHVSNILAKLNLADRTQAALYAVKHGLAE